MTLPSYSITLPDALRALELQPGATRDEVRQSYLDLVRVWHPDRFESDARLRALAEKRLTAINEAYRLLCSTHAIPTPRVAYPATPPPVTRRSPTIGGSILTVLAVLVIAALAMMPRPAAIARPAMPVVAATVPSASTAAAAAPAAPHSLPSTAPSSRRETIHPRSFIARETDAVLARSRR
jgi:hypothetical protein